MYYKLRLTLFIIMISCCCTPSAGQTTENPDDAPTKKPSTGVIQTSFKPCDTDSDCHSWPRFEACGLHPTKPTSRKLCYDCDKLPGKDVAACKSKETAHKTIWYTVYLMIAVYILICGCCLLLCCCKAWISPSMREFMAF